MLKLLIMVFSLDFSLQPSYIFQNFQLGGATEL